MKPTASGRWDASARGVILPSLLLSQSTGQVGLADSPVAKLRFSGVFFYKVTHGRQHVGLGGVRQFTVPVKGPGFTDELRGVSSVVYHGPMIADKTYDV